MSETRQHLAQDIADGLAGWYQLHYVQKLGGLSGEDSARFIVAQIVNAQGQYLPATSQLPTNWGATKRRIDIALKARRQEANKWYGAIEIKWPGDHFDADQARLSIVQDATRLAFVEAANLNAKFLIVGGSDAALRHLFDDAHPRSPDAEARRKQFNKCFKRTAHSKVASFSYAALEEHFPEGSDRVPANVFGAFNGKLRILLLATAVAYAGGGEAGRVYVWQCNRLRGAAKRKTRR